MEYVAIFERLMEKVGMPISAMLIISYGVWQMLKPIVNNINKSTDTLTGLCAMLAEHNQRAIDMHHTCQTHGEYICDAKDILNNNREIIMTKLGDIHHDVKNLGR